MAHQKELEKSKYRNWVRGGLAYKYLKQGIDGFADDVVQQEHIRILKNINHTPGLTCNQCSLGSFRPKHACPGMVTCPRSLRNCSCLNRKKKPCPNNICDAIMEEILDSHYSNGSQPPTPSWKNSDIQKWSSDPWEVAKCFIHAPGYSDKASASDIDAAGLLHVFINNINLKSYLSCKVSGNGTDIFSKTLNRRNAIFHSSTMELEDNELNQCIDDILAILEDEKQLKQRPDAQRAVEKLNQLKLGSFIITTNTEVEVCRDAMVSITNRSEELKQIIRDTKDIIDQKKTEVSEAVDDKTRKALDGALKQLEEQNDSQLQTMKKAIELLSEGLENVQRDYTAVKLDISLIQNCLSKIENSVAEIDTTKYLHKNHLEYVKQKHALQSTLVERYEKGYFKTWISPLKTHENDIDVNELYVTPNMVAERKTSGTASTKTCSGPGTTKGLSENYTFDDNSRPVPGKHSAESQFTTISRYRDIFQTGSIMHQKIYIIGDVGTGKSTLSKMMIYNWCRAVRGDNTNPESRSDTYHESKESEEIQAYNIGEMSKFNFLFLIPLQRMSGFSSDIKEMIKVFYKDVMTDELLNEIFNQESERCLVIADGLDEWTPPKYAHSPLHVSYGMPVGDDVKNATLVTLSRPSATGMINMRSSEYDQKITLMGVHEESLYTFTEKYMMVNPNRNANIDFFLEKIKEVNLVHLEKTPLILQQLIWMFCIGNDIGKSVSDIYGNVINIMISWSEKKGEEDTTQSSVSTDREFKRTQLPVLLRSFPRCEENKRILILLGKLSFKVLTEDEVSTFGRSVLNYCGLSRDDIGVLIRSGILVEYNCFDPTIESTYLSFIHISYLEFFAAVYISSHYSEEHLINEQKPELESRTVLKELFMKYKSAQDILQLSNLLKMVCGLSPFLLEDISSRISENMMIGDSSMIRYRNKHLQSNYSGEQDAPWYIQNLIQDCLEECRTTDQLAVTLSDVMIGSVDYRSASLSEPFLQTIVSSSVLSLKYTEKYHLETIKWIGKFHQLQFIRIDSIFSCTTCEQLSSSLTESVFLKSLTLNDIICDNHTCEGHTIDLRRHNRLQSIHLKCCTVMLSSLVNTESLETVSITRRDMYPDN